MIGEEMTIDELLSWANGLGICEFKKRRKFDRDEIACEKGKVCISLHFMRFNESVPRIGGMRAVSCDFLDERDGYSGGGGGKVELSDVARFIERYAEKLGLMSDQLSLFSML